MERPNFQFLTTQDFKTYAEYVNWYDNLTRNQIKTMKKIKQNLPKLLMIAEMFFDNEKSKPEGVPFNFVNETLKSIADGKPTIIVVQESGENFHKAIAHRLIALGFEMPIIAISNPKKSASMQFFDEYEKLNIEKLAETMRKIPFITELDFNCNLTFSDHTQSKFINKPKRNFKTR